MSSSEESFELNSSSDPCSGDNDILSSIPQLSDELEYFGLRPLPQLKNEESSVLLQTQVSSLVSSLIDTIWNLLQLHRSTLQQCDDVEDRRHRAADDKKNLWAQVDHLKTELSNKEQLLSAASEKERRLSTECDKLRRDLRTGKGEVHRLMAEVTQRDCQHAHELRKKEHEVLHVQEHLRHYLGLPHSVTHQVMKEKQQEINRKPAHEVCSSSTFDVSSNSRGDTAMPKEQEDLYRKVINKFESNNRRLVEENIRLRDTYCKLHTNLGFLTQQFAVLLEKYFKRDTTGHEFEEGDSMLNILPSSVFQMPYDGIREYNKEMHLLSDKYFATLHTVLEKLSNHMESQHSS